MQQNCNINSHATQIGNKMAWRREENLLSSHVPETGKMYWKLTTLGWRSKRALHQDRADFQIVNISYWYICVFHQNTTAIKFEPGGLLTSHCERSQNSSSDDIRASKRQINAIEISQKIILLKSQLVLSNFKWKDQLRISAVVAGQKTFVGLLCFVYWKSSCPVSRCGVFTKPRDWTWQPSGVHGKNTKKFRSIIVLWMFCIHVIAVA